MESNNNYLLMIKSNGVGDSEPDLGATLMRSFLNMIWESGNLPAKIICLASGVFLTTEGTPIADILGKFEAKGTEILSCTTCLEYYGRKEKLVIGGSTTMKESVAAILSYQKVVYA